MEVARGEIWWADLPEPRGAEPGYRRPVLVVQSEPFNKSRIRTVIVAVVTSNCELAEAPGNVLLPARVTGLLKDSVVNVSQLITVDRRFLIEPHGLVPARVMALVDTGLRRVLGL